jgi:GAF domain-containing protein
LDATRRYEGELAGRLQAQASDARHRFLARANALLGASMDLEVSLRKLTELAVPGFADGCLVHLRTPDGGLSLLAALTATRRARAPSRSSAAAPREGDERRVLARHAQSDPGAALDGTGAMGGAGGQRGGARPVAEVGMQSSLSVPLFARNRSLGAVTFLSSRGGRPLTENDLALVVDLAERAGGPPSTARCSSGRRSGSTA